MGFIVSNNSIDKTARAWTSPTLTKLGKLQDVAPGVPGITEGASGKS